MTARLCNKTAENISLQIGGLPDNVIAELPLFYHSSISSLLPVHQITFKSCIFYITFYAD
ncbi:hypothetical protein F2A92_22670 [Salmonella enterica]|uniref:Uncharacterized protein n=1 Tax=Salmonella diarizonae TaxID=59204 RepID=A0A726USG2_SALDZ|nr:hypothetical protein [Salmonella enterica]EBP3906878.1 hypothetical protein [Salmonella enterica subsp. enterica]HAB1916072.1 hypothetical protein [Salmonella enterica subsp. diarizonae]EAV5830238.1 hypothetical protein [Salmonella enterica]EAW5860297.1 hypothetical protein [Salmonella enterica]